MNLGESREELEMTAEERNKLAAMLIDLDLHEIREEERIADGDRNFDKLKYLAEVQGAIQTILKYVED